MLPQGPEKERPEKVLTHIDNLWTELEFDSGLPKKIFVKALCLIKYFLL